MDLSQSQESDRMIQYFVQQQIKKVEEDCQSKIKKEDEERNKIKQQVWNLLFKNNDQNQQIKQEQQHFEILDISKLSDTQPNKIIDQIIAKYEEKTQNKLQSNQSNYYQQSQQQEEEVFSDDQDDQNDNIMDKYNESFEDYEPIEEDISLEESTLQKKSQLINQDKLQNDLQQSFKASLQKLQLNISNKLNQSQSNNEIPNKSQISYFQNKEQQENQSQTLNNSKQQINDNNNNNEKFNDQSQQIIHSFTSFNPSQIQNQKQSQLTTYKFAQDSLQTQQTQQQQNQTLNTSNNLYLEEDISQHQEPINTDEDDNDANTKFYQFSIKFDEDSNEDKLKRFENLRKKKIQEMEELQLLRAQRLKKDSSKKEFSNPISMMPSAVAKKKKTEETLPPTPTPAPRQQSHHSEIRTPQMRNTSANVRKSPIGHNKYKETAQFNEEKGDRSASFDKGKNNKKILRNAITYVCLAGEPNRREREQLLLKLEQAEAEHYLLLFKGLGRMDVKGLYGFNGSMPFLIFGLSKCPLYLSADMVQTFFKYDSGAKQFKPIDGNKQFTVVVDGVQLRK